jgi:hypothetical protein
MTINYQDINISVPNTLLLIILKVLLYHDHQLSRHQHIVS